MLALERTLRYFVIAGVFAVVLVTPFLVFDALFFPYVVGKATFFRILTFLIFAAWVVLVSLNRKYLPPFNWLTATFGLFLVWMAIANMVGIAPMESFWSNYERMGGYLTLLHIFALFFVSTAVIDSKKLWFSLFHLSVIAAFVMGFVALGEYTEGVRRASALLGNPIYLGGYMLFHVFLSIYFLLDSIRRNIYLSLIYTAFIIFFVSMVLVTGTRGAMLGLIVGLFFSAFAVALRKKEKLWIRLTAFGGIAIASLIGLALTSVVLVNSYEPAMEMERLNSFSESVRDLPGVDRFARISLSEGDALARFLLWDIAVEGISKRPVFGWGQENYIHLFNSFYNPKLYDREEWFDRVHNIFLEWGVAGGIPGILLYTAIFAVAILLLWRSRELDHYIKTVFTALLLAHAVQNFFVFENITSYIFFAVFLGFVATVTTDRKAEVSARAPVPHLYVKWVVLPVVCVATVFSVYTFHIKPLQANMMIIQGMRGISCGAQVGQVSWDELDTRSISQIKDGMCGRYLPSDTVIRSSSGTGYTEEEVLGVIFDEVVSGFRNATERSFVAGQEAAEMLSTQIVRVSALNISEGKKFEILSESVGLLDSVKERTPKKTRPALFAGNLYMNMGMYEEAVEAFEEALSIASDRQYVLLFLTDAYNRLGEHEKALEVSKRAHELEPSFKEPLISYAVSARYLRDEELVSEILKPLSDSEIVFEDDLLEPFVRMGERDRVIDVRRERVDILTEPFMGGDVSPSEDELNLIGREYGALIRAYRDNDQIPRAIEVGEEAADRFPQFKSAIENMIEQIRE